MKPFYSAVRPVDMPFGNPYDRAEFGRSFEGKRLCLRA